MAGDSSSKMEFLIWLSQIMGGLCSRFSQDDDMVFAKTGENAAAAAAGGGGPGNNKASGGGFTTAPLVGEIMERRNLAEQQQPSAAAGTSGGTDDDFYDGIPRFLDSFPYKSRSVRSRQAAVAKVSEVSLRLGRAGTIGLGKAVEVLDNLGSSMTSLNAGSGFVSGAAIKGNEIGILAFEVANTIVKGYSLMQFLSRKNIRHLKEEVLLSEAVQDLVSNDMDELLWIVALDKRQELKEFSDEVIRFGNRSKNPQWHNLDRYFEKVSRESNAQRQSRDEAESTMEQLMTLVQFTVELYHELHALTRFEQDYLRQCEEEDNLGSSATQKGDSLAFLKAEIKSQKKQIKHLRKKSLWSRSLEELMEMLVDIVQFLNLEINDAFGAADNRRVGCMNNCQRLGPAGLALHYANLVIQIDTLVARSSSMPPSTRDALYQGLPPNIKKALRSKLSSFHIKEELTVADIKEEMEKTLHWLVPIASNTSKAHHGFGWVGEWANAGSEVNRKTFQAGVTRIETFHHADKEKVEKYILELVLWLQQLAIKNKAKSYAGKVPATIKTSLKPKPLLTVEEQKMLQSVSKKMQIRRISKSLDFDSVNSRLREKSMLNKSYSHSSITGKSNGLLSFKRIFSKLPVIDFGIDKERALDVIDRLDVIR